MWRRLALVWSLAAALAPLKSFGKTKGRGIRIQDKKGNANEAVVELFLGTAELETATVGGQAPYEGEAPPQHDCRALSQVMLSEGLAQVVWTRSTQRRVRALLRS